MGRFSITLVLLAAVTAVDAYAAETAAQGRSVCDIAGNLLAGCVGRPSPRPRTGELTLEFEVGGPGAGVVQSVSDATGKTVLRVLVSAEDRQQRTHRPVEGVSDWCAQMKKN